MDKIYNTSTKWRVYASWGVMTLPKIQCIGCTIFSAKNSFLIPVTGNETGNGEGTSHI
jgi:hypothetical protein